MSSPTRTMSPMNDLPAQLKQIGLKTLAANLDDFLARAAKGHWSPRMLLEPTRPGGNSRTFPPQPGVAAPHVGDQKNSRSWLTSN